MKYLNLLLAFLLLGLLGCSGDSLLGVQVENQAAETETVAAAKKTVKMVPFKGTFFTTPDLNVVPVQCVFPNGDPVPDLIFPGRFFIEGTATHLGNLDEENSNVTVGGCTFFPAEGLITGPVTGVFTGANGDAIFATGTTDILLDGTFLVDWIITGGTGRFEEASGWFDAVGTELELIGRGMISSVGSSK